MGYYSDKVYCPNCKEETTQEFYSAGHERDCSNDSVRCKVCDFYRSYNEYTDEEEDER